MNELEMLELQRPGGYDSFDEYRYEDGLPGRPPALDGPLVRRGRVPERLEPARNRQGVTLTSAVECSCGEWSHGGTVEDEVEIREMDVLV